MQPICTDKKSQHLPRLFYNSAVQTKKSAAAWFFNNIMPVFIALPYITYYLIRIRYYLIFKKYKGKKCQMYSTFVSTFSHFMFIRFIIHQLLCKNQAELYAFDLLYSSLQAVCVTNKAITLCLKIKDNSHFVINIVFISNLLA